MDHSDNYQNPIGKTIVLANLCRIGVIKKAVLVLVFFSTLSPLFAQETSKEKNTPDLDKDAQLLYRNEQEFGGLIHSDRKSVV